MRSKIVIVVIMAFGSALLPGNARAGLATQLLFVETPPVINQLEDEDWENINSSNNSKLELGEELYGVWAVQKVNRLAAGGGSATPGGGTDWFTVVFAMEVKAKVQQSDGNWVFGFGPTDNSTFTTLTGKSRTNPNTIGLVFSDPNGISTPPSSVSDVAGTLLWEIGFATPSYNTSDTKDLGIENLTYFWVAETVNDNFSGNRLGLGYVASLDVLVTTSDGLPLLPHNHLNTIGLQVRDLVFPDVSSPVQLHGSDEGRIGSSDLPLKTDTDIYVKPTPEPSSLVALVGLGLAVMVRRSTRRRVKV